MREYKNFIEDNGRWRQLAIRDGDIVISTPAKCGTTWMQRCVSLVLGVEPTPERPMAVISPWLDMLTRPIESVVADLDAQGHRRFIKTHTPLDGLPDDPRLTYITVARDPRDVALSWAAHYDNMAMDVLLARRIETAGADDFAELFPDGPPPPPPTDPRERFWHWAEVPSSRSVGRAVSGLQSVVGHIETFWRRRHEPNVHLFHYAEMKADLPAQLRRLADALGVDTSDDQLATWAEQASFQAMKERAEELAPNAEANLWKATSGFFDRGRSGGWRELLDGEDLARYDKLVSAAGDQDLIRWIHEGGPTT